MGNHTIMTIGHCRSDPQCGAQTLFAFSLLASCLSLMSGCGESSATLSVTLQDLPEFTNQLTLNVQGSVSRAPSKETVTIVAVAGASQTVTDSLAAPGAFSIQVQLKANQENQLAITASDASGAVSDAVIVSVFHDDVGPQIAQMSPPRRGIDIALDTPIEVEFAEPLVAQATASIRFLHNGEAVPGTATLSTDLMRVSFIPSVPLEPNSVYQLAFTGYTDGTGNPLDVDTEACFLTTDENLITHADRDSGDGSWVQGDPEASKTRTDIREVLFARLDSTLYSIVEFADERSFGGEENDNTIMFVEIDADQNPATGVISLRDTVFNSFPELDSDLGVEFIFGLEDQPALGDSAYVGIMTAPLEFDVLELYNVGICGRYWGFHHTVFLGSDGDDGLFDYTVIAFTIGEEGNLIDIMPESGSNTADVSGLTAPPPGAYRDNIVRRRGPAFPARVSGALTQGAKRGRNQ